MAQYCKSCADPQDILKVQIALEVTKETKTPKGAPSLAKTLAGNAQTKQTKRNDKMHQKNPLPRDQARGRY